MRQLDEEAAAGRAVAAPEEPGVALGDGLGTVPVAHPQAPGDLAVAAARQRDEPLGVLGQERLREAGHPLRAGHVGVRDEAAQAPPADRRAGQQHEVGAAGPFADPAQVLLDRLAMAGEARALGPWPLRDAVERHPRRVPGVRCPPAASSRAPRRDHDPVGVRGGRVEQLDLDPDDRMQPDGLSRPDEAHRAVQAGVVGDGQPGQPQLDGPLDQVVRRRGAVEEREVRVAVQFRVRGRGHETLRVAGLEGACQYRTSVLSRYARSAPGPTAGWTTRR